MKFPLRRVSKMGKKDRVKSYKTFGELKLGLLEQQKNIILHAKKTLFTIVKFNSSDFTENVPEPS